MISLNLLTSDEKISEIIGIARIESEIQNKIRNVQNTWKNAQFDVDRKREKIRNLDTLINSLEEDMFHVHVISSSRFVTPTCDLLYGNIIDY